MKLKASGMHFDRLGNLCFPVLGLIFYLVIDIELLQEGLHVVLILDGNEAGFKILGDIYFLLVSLALRDSILFI